MNDELMELKDWKQLMDQAGMTASHWFNQIKRLHPELTDDQIIKLCDIAVKDYANASNLRIEDERNKLLISVIEQVELFRQAYEG